MQVRELETTDMVGGLSLLEPLLDYHFLTLHRPNKFI